ncbi:MAG: glycosyltransferase [Thermoprotei archaeon]
MKFAVVITVYKRYNYIHEAIRSALEQSLKPVQVIVVADDISKLKDVQGVTLVEVNHPYHGKVISEGAKAVHDDVDAIAFLEDDDLFHRDKLKILSKIINESKTGIILVHNFQKFIDAEGKEAGGYIVNHLTRNQPRSSVIVTRDNVVNVARLYPAIHHNLSSMTVRKEFLEKIRDKLANFWSALDFAIFYLAIEHGKVLHVPDSLTYYRIGSGETTQFYSSKDFNDHLQKRLCVLKKYLQTFRMLITFLENCRQCKALVERELLFDEIFVALLDGRFNCGLPEPISASTYEIAILNFKSLLSRQISLSTFLKTFLAIGGLYVLGKKRVSDMYVKYLYRLESRNSIH